MGDSCYVRFLCVYDQFPLSAVGDWLFDVTEMVTFSVFVLNVLPTGCADGDRGRAVPGGKAIFFVAWGRVRWGCGRLLWRNRMGLARRDREK